MTYILFVAGLVALVFGGEWLVRGASGLARRLGVSPLVIGMTIVGFGTSMPELLVSIQAAIDGAPAIAIGNVVGSNIANVLLILGAAAALSPIVIGFAPVRRDLVIGLLASLLLWAMIWNGELSRLEGLVLLAGLGGFLFLSFRGNNPEEQFGAPPPLPMNLLMTGAGLVLLMVGARLMVTSAAEIARDHGISEAVIGLTIVAVGTSLPEFAASVAAARRGHAEIAVGNVIGSNIFNILGILGVTAMMQPIPVAERFFELDMPIAIAVAVGLLLLLATGRGVPRWSGLGLLACYAGYIGTTAIG